MKSVCVLMSTYNGEKYLKEQLNSILKQKIEADISISILVRDDGSNDTTLDILREYEEQSLLTWYSGINIRPARSFWDLINHATGFDYYAFCDQDDVWFEDKIARALKMLENKEYPVLYASAYQYTDMNLTPIHVKAHYREHYTDFFHSLIYSTAPGCTFVFNELARNILTEYKMDDSNNYMHDWLAQKIITMYGEMYYDSKPSMYYRQHGNNVIGVRYVGLKAKLQRFRELMTSRGSERSDCARCILSFYNDCKNEDKLFFIKNLANYKDSFKCKINLLLQNKTRTSMLSYNFIFKLLILANKV